MHVWRCGLRPDLLREVRRFPDLIFRPQNHQKRLAAGLRPDPLGELERSPRPPSTVGAMDGNTLAAVKALPRPHFHTIKSPQTFGGRAPLGPLGELERSPRPPSTVGAMEGNTPAAAKALPRPHFQTIKSP